MLREDYEKALPILQSELPEELVVSHWSLSNHMFSIDSIIRIVEPTSHCFIDIFPYDRVPGALSSSREITQWEREYSEIFKYFGQKVGTTGMTENLMHEVEGWRSKHLCGDGDKEGIAMGVDFVNAEYGGRIFPADKVLPLTKALFDGTFMPVPQDSAYYLNAIYGDYMQFPADVGVPKHSNEISGTLTRDGYLSLLERLTRIADRYEGK